jgi:hypothetical protein
LTVRLFRVTPGKLAAPAPPIIIFEVAPPTSVPQFIMPLSVIVFAPIDNPAPVGLNVPDIVGELCKVTILVLVIERPFKATMLVGIKTPAEVPPKTRLEAAVVIRFEGVPAIAGPFNVRVKPATVRVLPVRVRVPLTEELPANVLLPLPEIVRLKYGLILTVCAAPEKLTVFPLLEAVRVVMPEVPPRFSVEFIPCVNPPVPASAVPTVNVPLLVRVMPVTVTLGIENVPVIA